MSRNGAISITISAETSNGVTSSVMIATRGSAIPVIWEPNWLIVSAVQSLRKSACRQSPPCGQTLRIAHLPVSEREPVRRPAGCVCRAEVVDQLLQTPIEASGLRLREAREDEAEARALRRTLELERRVAERRRAERARVRGILGREEEQAGDPAVELLRQGPHLARVHDADEPGALEHLQVVPHRPLRDIELARELLCRPRALSQEADDSPAQLVAERAQL